MALDWQRSFDPDETLDYSRDWTQEMDASTDTISTVSFVLPQDAIDAGMQIITQGPDATNKIAIAWFTSNDPDATLAAFANQKIGVDHTINTVEGRVFNETLRLRIREA